MDEQKETLYGTSYSPYGITSPSLPKEDIEVREYIILEVKEKNISEIVILKMYIDDKINTGELMKLFEDGIISNPFDGSVEYDKEERKYYKEIDNEKIFLK